MKWYLLVFPLFCFGCQSILPLPFASISIKIQFLNSETIRHERDSKECAKDNLEQNVEEAIQKAKE